MQKGLCLYLEHERWAVNLARRYAVRTRVPQHRLEQGAVEQSARIVLWRISQRYKPSRGKFRTFAYRRIIGGVQDELRQQGFWGDTRKRDQPEVGSLGQKAFVREAKTTRRDDSGDYIIAMIRDTAVREMFFLYYIKGLTMKEIGAETHCTEGYISRRMREELLNLQELLNDYSFPELHRAKDGVAAIPTRSL